jgi:hypothetical protein
MATAKAPNVDELIDEGREKLDEFAEKGFEYVASARATLLDFVRDEPLLAVAGAFAVGYIAARLLNQVTRR